MAPLARLDTVGEDGEVRRPHLERWAAVAVLAVPAACGDDAASPPAATGTEPPGSVIGSTTGATGAPTTNPPTTLTSVPPSTGASPAGAATTAARATDAPATTASTTTAPTVPGRPDVIEGTVTLPTGELTTGDDDLFVLHADGDLWLHPGVLDGSPGGPVRIVDYDDPGMPVDEGPGPNVIDHVAGVVDGTLIYGDCCEPIAGTVLTVTRPDAGPELLLFGYTPTLAPDRERLATANDYGVTVADLAAGTTASSELDEGDDHVSVLGIEWVDDDALGLLMLSGGEFSLVPYTAEPPVPAGPPVTLDIEFDPEGVDWARLAGRGPDGEVAVALGGPSATEVRFLDPVTLGAAATPGLELPPTATWVQLASDDAGLLWGDGDEVRYRAVDGQERSLGSGYLAAWFAA
jgi:hypothetical protein